MRRSADAPTTLEGKKMGQPRFSKQARKIFLNLVGGVLFLGGILWGVPSCEEMAMERDLEIQTTIAECMESCVARNGKASFNPTADYVSEVACRCEIP